MSSQIPPADGFLLAKARAYAENKLVESVRLKTQADVAKRVVEEFRVEARANRVANAVFDSEYKASLAEMLPNSTDRELLAGIYRGKVVDRLVDESTAVYRKAIEQNGV